MALACDKVGMENDGCVGKERYISSINGENAQSILIQNVIVKAQQNSRYFEQ